MNYARGVSIIKLRAISVEWDCAWRTHNQYNQIIILSRRKCVLTNLSIGEKASRHLVTAQFSLDREERQSCAWGHQKGKEHRSSRILRMFGPIMNQRRRVSQVQVKIKETQRCEEPIEYQVIRAAFKMPEEWDFPDGPVAKALRPNADHGWTPG